MKPSLVHYTIASFFAFLTHTVQMKLKYSIKTFLTSLDFLTHTVQMKRLEQTLLTHL